ncbi:MAG: DUF2800 domain-containing protein [Negativicutes bacterium]|nr:DUF2800 domain-containing protein [Negativicutes bacterium]
MTAHAVLSASGAHRWLPCTPSARLEATLPDNRSEYADEGTLAHSIGELKLRKQFVEPISARTYKSRLKKLQADPLYNPEMESCTDFYLDYVSQIALQYPSAPHVAVERKLHFTGYVPEAFGTGDCVVLHDSNLHVIDYKHGKGVPVSAFENPQMLLYALGAYLEYSLLYPIETVKMAIVQPRVSQEPSEWEMPIADLLAWGESIKPIAQKAFAGEGEYVAGDHCRFCRARSLCRARAVFCLEPERHQRQQPALLNKDELGDILTRAQVLAKWAKDVEAYCLNACLGGEDIPGWKAVEGRGSRIFTDQDAAFNYLVANGISDAMLYERKPLTAPAVEKLLGKAQYRELLEDKGHIHKEAGKPTLVPAKDKREAIKSQSAADVFKN